MAAMTRKNIVITGGDAAYFDLMRGCVASIRDKPESRNVALGVLDCGLEAAQRSWLAAQDAMLVSPRWDFDFPGRADCSEAFKALTARPFLPTYFPGYDTYLWIDADCWVQHWFAIDLFLKGAARRPIAVAPEIHRAFRHYRHAWPEFSAVNGAAFRQAFGADIADRLVRYPLINAGVFAIQTGSPAWGAWATMLDDALQRSTNMTDQIALNVAVYERGLAAEALPSTCNWPVHHALPAWDIARGLFVEPSLPHDPLGILHMTIYTKTVPSFDIVQIGGDADGTTRPMTVRYVPPGESRTRAPTPDAFRF
ncbi:hypothetical protein [Reyranella sp. CPCC 100927]|uniref:hypothetical protein n=1 Tax=Reyranella sp. CPCC 100927 TaxID=2599616 RepID=UPI0011B61027|nr:hypothetical protein [Reyranella sp. CPCC 100927]TWT15557.1 hypothetical protein FQU96_04180 [Reyranella sp. CPCC 100927]